MNDPNGLTYTPDGKLHLFYQANPNSTQAPWAPHQAPQVWGHATSSDLVHFEAADPPFSAIAGSSGGAVSLPPALRASSGFAAVASTGGLRMWTSSAEDGDTLARWNVSSGSALSNNPMALVPNTSTAGRNGAGDNTAWLSSDKRSVYVLSGGYSQEHGPQALLFRSNSSTLLDWEFVSVWYTGLTTDGTTVPLNCPDAFQIGDPADGRWAFIWLAHPRWHAPFINIWMIGTVDPATQFFREEHRGLADQSSSFIAAQSLTWTDGRRVQFAWVGTPVSDGATGAQIMAREIKPSSDGTRLLFYPVEEVERGLHQGLPVEFNNVSVTAGLTSLRNGSIPFGQTIHVKVTVTLPEQQRDQLLEQQGDQQLGVSVLGLRLNATLVRSASSSWSLDVPGFTRADEPHTNVRVDGGSSGVVVLDVFVDRSVTEVFVSDAVGQGSVAVTASVAPKTLDDAGVALFWTGASPFLVASVKVWEMGKACPWS
eukprot:g3788.t1